MDHGDELRARLDELALLRGRQMAIVEVRFYENGDIEPSIGGLGESPFDLRDRDVVVRVVDAAVEALRAQYY